MAKIFSALIGGFAVLAFSFPVVASQSNGLRVGSLEIVAAKKKCKSGYVYNPTTKKCYPRGSH